MQNQKVTSVQNIKGWGHVWGTGEPMGPVRKPPRHEIDYSVVNDKARQEINSSESTLI